MAHALQGLIIQLSNETRARPKRRIELNSRGQITHSPVTRSHTVSPGNACCPILPLLIQCQNETVRAYLFICLYGAKQIFSVTGYDLPMLKYVVKCIWFCYQSYHELIVC